MYEQEIQQICDYAIEILKVKNIKFRPMRRTSAVNPRRYVLGRTNLKTGLITIDILTARKRKPKKIASILKILAHEIAHHQKKPFRQRFRGYLINRQHYPEFYTQVKRNILIFREDKILSKYFEKRNIGCR